MDAQQQANHEEEATVLTRATEIERERERKNVFLVGILALIQGGFLDVIII